MILYVTRHGETEFNAQGRYAGSTDVPLNEKGFAQAKELALRLKGMRFDAIACSPMLRARQTADIVCAALDMPYVIYENFYERNMGVYEGLSREEVQELYPEMWNRKCTMKPDDAPDGGETLRQVCDRVDRGMERLRRDFEGKTILLICHGFVARAMNRYCKGLSFEEMANFTLGNCEVVEYELED